MKKILSTAFAAIMLAGGLVALSGGSSTAGEPYPGSIDTKCFAEALNNPRVGHDANVRFKVGTGGNGAARGIVNFSYERRSNGIIEDEFTRQYEGPGWTKYAFRGLPKGRYKVRVFFNSKPVDSVYQNCRTSFKQRVRPKK